MYSKFFSKKAGFITAVFNEDTIFQGIELKC